MSDDPRAEAEAVAVSALARREHSRFELARKLRARGIEQPTLEEVLESLKARGLQSDDRFAESYLSYRAGRGYGPRRIRMELGERGIDDTIVSDALADCDVDFFELAVRVRARKFRQAPRDLAERARQTRFLEYRGFVSDQIRYALDQAAGHEDI